MLDALLIVAAGAASAGLARVALAEAGPPADRCLGSVAANLVIAAFAGPWALGPCVQVAQAARLGRRRWTPAEWAWSVGGLAYPAWGWTRFCDPCDAAWGPPALVRAADLAVRFGPAAVGGGMLVGQVVARRSAPWSGWAASAVALAWGAANWLVGG